MRAPREVVPDLPYAWVSMDLRVGFIGVPHGYLDPPTWGFTF
jgi:hypothetical protein